MRAAWGFERAVAECGVDGEVIPTDPTPEGGYLGINHLLDNNPSITAIITLNSEALGTMTRAVQDRGLRIPDDLSVVAITSARMAEFLTPPLTSLDFPAAEMGRIGTQMLLDQLEKGGGHEPTHCLLQAPLTIRRSSGPAKVFGGVSG